MRPCSTHEISRLRGTTLVHQLDDLVRRCEVQLPGQRSLQVLLEELAMSANAALERHVHPVATILMGHGNMIGEQEANF